MSTWASRYGTWMIALRNLKEWRKKRSEDTLRSRSSQQPSKYYETGFMWKCFRKKSQIPSVLKFRGSKIRFPNVTSQLWYLWCVLPKLQLCKKPPRMLEGPLPATGIAWRCTAWEKHKLQNEIKQHKWHPLLPLNKYQVISNANNAVFFVQPWYKTQWSIKKHKCIRWQTWLQACRWRGHERPLSSAALHSMILHPNTNI